MINNKKVVGIIAEYDPFHNGHKYQIDLAKKISGADIACIVMSGPFMQRGSLSMFSPQDRAYMAILNGANIVFELPIIFSLADAQRFSDAGVKILDDLSYIDYISFSCENKNITELKKIADVISKESFYDKASLYLKKGISYAEARGLAIKDILGDEYYSIIRKPNNILGISYLISLKKFNSKIKPIIIERSGEHISYNIDKVSPSATAIRENLLKGNLQEALTCVPESSKEYIKDLILKQKINRNEFINELSIIELLRLSKNQISDIPGISEGLENKIVKTLVNCSNINDLLDSIKSKRYTLSRLKRAISYSMLNINTSILQNNPYPIYTKLLAYDSIGKSLLNRKSKIKIIKRASDIKDIDYSLDRKAYDMWKVSADFGEYKIFEIKSN